LRNVDVSAAPFRFVPWLAAGGLFVCVVELDGEAVALDPLVWATAADAMVMARATARMVGFMGGLRIDDVTDLNSLDRVKAASCGIIAMENRPYGAAVSSTLCRVNNDWPPT
jgi:hypothetical protein